MLPLDTGHRPKYQRQRSPVDIALRYPGVSIVSNVLSSLSSSRIVASIQAFLLCAFPIESGTAESPWQLSSPRQGTPLHIAYRSKQHRHRTGRFTCRSQCG
jgi:hypothetical protein